MKLVVGVSNVLVPAPLARTGVLARPCIAFRFGRSGPMPAGMPQSLAVRCDTSTATPKKRQVAKKEKVPPLPTVSDFIDWMVS